MRLSKMSVRTTLAFCFVCCLIALMDASQQLNVETLQFVHVLWRHGDRTPVLTFPDDPSQIVEWPRGLGELTKTGMRQHFELGKFIAKRYEGFLNESYSPFEIYIRSTDRNRTIMSASANLAGAYPPAKSQQFEPDLFWQPIPVHTISSSHDLELNLELRCPKYDTEYYGEVQKSPEVLRIMKKHEPLIQFLRNKTGFKLEYLCDIWMVFDLLEVEDVHNVSTPWPQWMNQSLFDQIFELQNLATSFYYHRKSLQRLRGGLLLGDILYRMLSKSNGSLDHRLKYYVYSAHDLNIISLLENLGAYNKIQPPYASAVFVELHKKDSEYFVQVFYKNSSRPTDPLIAIEIADCGGTQYVCELGNFTKRSISHIPTDWFKECGLDSQFQQIRTVITEPMMVAMLTAVIVALILVLGICLISSLRNKRQTRRQQDFRRFE